MSLYGKDLRPGSEGDDVAELHALLDLTGHPAPRDEVAERVFKDGTAQSVTEFQHSVHLDPTAVVDDETVAALERAAGEPEPPPDHPEPALNVVRGQVMYRRGLAISGVRMRALHRALREDVFIGPTVLTDDRGEFSIEYDPQDVPGGRVDLQVRAFADAAAAELGRAEDGIGQSRIFYSATPLVKVRLRINGGPDTRWTEFQQAVAEVTEHTDGLAIADLEEGGGHRDLSLLAGKTNQPLKRLADLVIAHRLAAAADVSPQTMYGLVRRGIATDLASLASQGEERMQAALQSASDRGLVPASATEDVGTLVDALRTAAVNNLAANPDQVGGLLRTLGDTDARKSFVTALIDHGLTPGPLGENVGAPPPDLWARVSENPQLREHIPMLQLDMQLTALTGAHAPLVASLADRLDGSSVQALAGYSTDDFATVIAELPAGERVPPEIVAAVAPTLSPDTAPELKDAAEVKAYAAMLHTIVAETMPTAVLATKLAADDSTPAAAKTFWHNVLEDGTHFELRQGLRPSELNPALFAGLDDGQRVEALKEIATVKRLFNITTDATHMKVLRDNGLDSAQAITDLGASTFISRFAGELGGETQALKYATNATNVSATSAALFSSFAPALNDVPMYVLPAYLYEGQPDLETLFGSLDLCECEDCRSILSPAAYLAEVLAWLAERMMPDGGTVLDELYRRRPDIGEIELSCVNTNTTLPYIDLVIELLENQIAPISTVVLDAASAAALDAETIPDAVRSSFDATVWPLTPDHRCFVVTADQHWFLTDHSELWVLRRTSPTEIAATFGSHQTRADAATLSVEPEHRNPLPYTELSQARYPVSAPLDLWTEEVRAHIGHLLEQTGDSPHNRRDLMLGVAPITIDPATDVDIASESLGITVGQRRVMTIGNNDPWLDYGTSESDDEYPAFNSVSGLVEPMRMDWNEALGWVNVLLRQLGLEYPQLLEILDTDYVNPDRRIRIESADDTDVATCSVGKLLLTNIFDPDLERIRRFVRLRNALGWTARELDDVMTAVHLSTDGVLEINDALIVKLSAVDRLHRRLGITLAEMPCLWGPLPTRRPDDLYFQLFANPDVIRPVDPAFTLRTDGDGTDIAGFLDGLVDADIATHASTVTAALGITVGELEKLIVEHTGPRLSLANLTLLYRYVRMARALQLSMAEWHMLRGCSDDPFSSGPVMTEKFVDFVDAVRTSGFTIAEVNYLVYHQLIDPDQPEPLSERDIATVLDEMRTALRDVAADTDLAGKSAPDALRKWMASLHWPVTVVDEVAAILEGTSTSRFPLANVPAGLDIPESLGDRVSVGGGWLTVRGPLDTVARDALGNASGSADFRTAVDGVYTGPRDSLSRYLKTWRWPSLSADLPTMPHDVAIPTDMRARVYYDPSARTLVTTGPLTAEDADRLKQGGLEATWGVDDDGEIAAPKAWGDAVDALVTAIDAFTPDESDEIVGDSASLLNLEPADRIDRVALALGARLRVELSEGVVLNTFANQLGTPLPLLSQMLRRSLKSRDDRDRSAMSDFLQPEFIDSHPEVPLTSDPFFWVFNSYLRMYKLALIVDRLQLSVTELGWLTRYAGDNPRIAIPWVNFGVTDDWYSPNDLRDFAAEYAPHEMARFLRMIQIIQCAKSFGVDTIDQVLELARKDGTTLADLAKPLAAGASRTDMPVKAADLVTLATQRSITVTDLRCEVGLWPLIRPIELMRRSGASVAQLIAFAAAQPTYESARAARQVVKAHYADDQWAAIARPLRDVLRLKHRDALLEYVLADPKGTWPSLRGESELYRHLLLDSRTEPMVMTSRIKQAISSVQLFVQSAMMNLIPGVEVDAERDPGWRDWEWMKNYRIWEANRKIFCFPENWLDPSLRDDKTPLFAELESALMRDDVTADVVHDAFETYLAGLDDIARLEILGLYEVDAAAGAPATLYAVGRSRGRTPNYYWRTRIDNAEWTPWRKIDVDISEPQVVPVVWNGRLHLFWPIFADVTPQATPTEKPAYPAGRHYEITLAYTYFHRNKWQPKQMTEISVPTPLVPVDDKPDSVKSQVVLRAVVGSPDLWIWPEYDNPAVNISTVKPGYTPVDPGTNSVYMSVLGFHFTGRSRQVEAYGQDIAGIFEPTGTVPVGMLFAQKGSNRLNLPATLNWRTEKMALGSAPTAFSLAYPHQDRFISGARSFVYQDGQRCFVVDPDVGYESMLGFADKSAVSPDVVGVLKDKFYDHAVDYAVAKPDPVEFIAGHNALAHGTADPLRVALLNAAEKPTVAPTGLRNRRQSRAIGDQRSFVSKSDKAILKVTDYVAQGKILADLPIMLFTKVRRYLFRTAFHPYVGDFQRDLSAGGVEELVSRESQQRSSGPFASTYAPTELVNEPHPVEDVDFEPAGFFQQYNWELFFHAPFMIASRLSANQRFEDAQRWYHLIFDPTDTSKGPVPARFWKTKPLNALSQSGALPQRLSDIIVALASGTADAGLLRQVAVWRANPFSPFAISRMRLTAFQKTVVMSYLDNLVAWGDQLFRQDTIESINYATNLYMLAGDILGARPRVIPSRAEPEIRTPVSLGAQLATMSNTLVDIESVVGSSAADTVTIDPDAPPMSWPKMLYFGIPKNDKLFGYWDTVADRLFKIRNSMNIEGVTRQLPLFEPPIDPALLVRARAAGLDVASVLSEVSGAAPTYRFRALAAQAQSLANDVRSLGAALLAAMEKRDAEALAILRATHETQLIDAMEAIKEKQEAEARAQITALRAQRAQVVGRYQHYQRTLGVTTVASPAEDKPITMTTSSSNAAILYSEGVKLLSHDRAELNSLQDSRDSQTAGSVAQGAGSVLAVLPTFGFDAKPWGIGVGSSWGGANMAAAASAVASVFGANAASSGFDANKSSRLAQAVLRENDWVLQSNQSAAEIMTIDRQRLAAEIRLEAASLELANHRMSMSHARAAMEYLSGKYTNTELYDWMANQITSMYFQSYQLAYDTAKQAERALQRELGVSGTQYIQFGYWDSARKGLLAGERLGAAISRMQTEFMTLNRRTFEITKHISIANANPSALIELRETGSCTVQLPEALFDLDRPGDYNRRIKMVSLSLPCVTGPYTGVNCTMTLLSSQIRTAPSPAKPYRSSGPADSRFVYVPSVESIVTSSGRDDSGMFQPDMRDDRFLPFEGSGVVGAWRLELPARYRQFDYQTISDAVITIRYTAVSGGQPLRDAALAELDTALKAMEVGQGQKGLFKLLSARHDYPDQWYQMLTPVADPPAAPTFTGVIGPQRFPFAYHGRNVVVERLAIVLRTAPYGAGDAFTVRLIPPTGQPLDGQVKVVKTELGALPTAVFNLGAGVPLNPTDPWTVELTSVPAALAEQVQIGDRSITRLKRDAVEDFGMLLGYRLES